MKLLRAPRKYLFPFLGTAALVLASCGSNDTKTSTAEGNTSTEGTNASASAENTSASSAPVDACKLLTKADATTLFGKPASSQEPEMAPLPDQIGVCQWGWVGEERTQQLSLKAMSHPDDHFVMLNGAPPLDLGDKGELMVDESIGSIAVNWVENGTFFNLDYESNPFRKSKADPLKTLAKEISGRLQR